MHAQKSQNLVGILSDTAEKREPCSTVHPVFHQEIATSDKSREQNLRRVLRWRGKIWSAKKIKIFSFSKIWTCTFLLLFSGLGSRRVGAIKAYKAISVCLSFIFSRSTYFQRLAEKWRFSQSQAWVFMKPCEVLAILRVLGVDLTEDQAVLGWREHGVGRFRG